MTTITEATAEDAALVLKLVSEKFAAARHQGRYRNRNLMK